MVSNIAGGRPPRPGVEPGAQLGALEVHAAQAHGYLSAGGDQLARLADLLRPAVLESRLRSVRGGIDPMDAVDGRGLRGADLQRYLLAHPIAALMPLIDKLLVQDTARTGLIVVLADQFGRVLSVPYRLCVPVATDVEALGAALDSGDVDSALRLYAGPVLPRSTAPGIIDIRDELDCGCDCAPRCWDRETPRRCAGGPLARRGATTPRHGRPTGPRWIVTRRCMRRSRPRSGCWIAASAPMQRECDVSAHNLHSHRYVNASPWSDAVARPGLSWTSAAGSRIGRRSRGF
jgi:hypothetical protein